MLMQSRVGYYAESEFTIREISEWSEVVQPSTAIQVASDVELASSAAAFNGRPAGECLQSNLRPANKLCWKACFDEMEYAAVPRGV